MTLVDDLKAAKALIADEANWLPGWLRGENDGLYTVDQAVRAATLPGAELGRMASLCCALDRAVPSSFSRDERSGLREYIQYVDRYDPSHDDVLAMFDRAIAVAEASAS